MRKSLLLILAALLLSSASLVAQSSIPAAFSREAHGEKSFPPAPRLASRVQMMPAATLGPAAPAELDAVEQWNRSQRVPAKTGFARSINDTVAVSIQPGSALKSSPERYARGTFATTERGKAWSGTFVVDGAYRVRLHLENVRLPEGAVLWVYGEDGDAPIAFDRALLDPSGGLWTPSVPGPTVHLEIEVPAESETTAAFEIRELIQTVAPQKKTLLPSANDDPTCLIFSNCVSPSAVSFIDGWRAGVAQLTFVKSVNGQSGSYVCSGGLMNDINSSGTPYLLTANHCFTTAESAASLEAYWDYLMESCQATQIPDRRSGFPKSLGATLLATSTSSDFTFIRLNSVPAGRYFLGATSVPVTDGTTLLRISHPMPDGYPPLPQMFSYTTATSSFPACSSSPRPNFIYSTQTSDGGGVYGGSSGSVVVKDGGGSGAQIVGQLKGSCASLGGDPASGCDTRVGTMDGAMSNTWNTISTFLLGGGGPPIQACTPSATQVCLVNDRFAVKVNYDAGAGVKPMTAIKYTPNTGLFWFNDSTNIEILLKMVDACSFNQKFWVYAGGTTDVGLTITVTDSHTGTVKTYNNARGTAVKTITDSNAFATCGQ